GAAAPDPAAGLGGAVRAARDRPGDVPAVDVLHERAPGEPKRLLVRVDKDAVVAKPAGEDASDDQPGGLPDEDPGRELSVAVERQVEQRVVSAVAVDVDDRALERLAGIGDVEWRAPR